MRCGLTFGDDVVKFDSFFFSFWFVRRRFSMINLTRVTPVLCRYPDNNKLTGTIPNGISKLKKISWLSVIVVVVCMCVCVCVCVCSCGGVPNVSIGSATGTALTNG